MRFILPGSPSGEVVHQRNECCDFSGSAFSKGDFDAWRPPRVDLSLVIFRILGWPPSLARWGARSDFCGYGCIRLRLRRFAHFTLPTKKNLTIGLETLQQKKPWRSTTLCCRAEIRCATRVDALVDTQSVVHAWNNQGGWTSLRNSVMKIFHGWAKCVFAAVLHPD